jgi:hypothetical protein
LEKKQNQRTIGSGYLKNFRIEKNHWVRVFQKLQRTVGFHERTGKDPAVLGACLIYF